MTDTQHQFDEQAYLATNPDVATAVARGAFASGQEHYDLIGKAAGRSLGNTPVKPLPDVLLSKFSIVTQPQMLRDRLKEPHTFVVGGSSRGGSSSIEYALNHQGIDMGAPDSVNYEDPVFVKSITREKFDIETVANHIAARNSELDVWGVKLPDAVFHFVRLETMIRNPIFIMIYRNPVSVARSVMRRTNVFENDVEGLSSALRHASGFYGQFAHRLAKLASPTICIEYEQMLYNSEEALTEILTTIGIEPSNMAELVENVSRPGYKNTRLGVEM